MSLDSSVRKTAPCPICRSSEYEWGELGIGQILRYMPRDQSILSRMFVPWTGTRVSTRCCAKCGNLQLFTTD